MDSILAYGFPQRHPVLMSIMQHTNVIEHRMPDSALAAAVTQSVSAILLCSRFEVASLSAMSERWHAHPSTRTRPILLLGCDGWSPEEVDMATVLPADVYLPGTTPATSVLRIVKSLEQRFLSLTGKEAQSESLLPTISMKLETLLRNQSMTQVTSVNQMAYDSGMSLSRFQRTVKRMTGRSPIDYINYLKLERAYQLLATHSGTVSDIAYQCGFNSVAYFCKQFKREYGMTPGEVLGK
jgi:AraC-like DNA-binding protein